MSNQLSGKLVSVDAFEVVELLSLEIEDSRAKDDRYVEAMAVEYFSVHDWPSTALGPTLGAVTSCARRRKLGMARAEVALEACVLATLLDCCG